MALNGIKRLDRDYIISILYGLGIILILIVIIYYVKKPISLKKGDIFDIKEQNEYLKALNLLSNYLKIYLKLKKFK
jgi:hypothetical protein